MCAATQWGRIAALLLPVLAHLQLPTISPPGVPAGSVPRGQSFRGGDKAVHQGWYRSIVTESRSTMDWPRI